MNSPDVIRQAIIVSLSIPATRHFTPSQLRQRRLKGSLYLSNSSAMGISEIAKQLLTVFREQTWFKEMDDKLPKLSFRWSGIVLCKSVVPGFSLPKTIKRCFKNCLNVHRESFKLLNISYTFRILLHLLYFC